MRLSELSFSTILLLDSGRFVIIDEQGAHQESCEDIQQDLSLLSSAIAAEEQNGSETFSVVIDNYNYRVLKIEREGTSASLFSITRGNPSVSIEGLDNVSLNKLEFSDLLLNNGDTYMRGLRGFDREVISPPEEVHDEIEELRTLVTTEFDQHKRNSFRIEYKGLAYRVAVFDGITSSGSGHAFSLRKGIDTISDFNTLGLPPFISKWLTDPNQKKGLILFTGAQASGKTTSAASLIAKRLAKFGGHALSIEMPAEMPLSGKHGQSGTCWQCDLDSEADLKSVLQVSHRSTADIIHIGEILGTITASELLQISLSSSRQLIISTIHGNSIVAALDRLLTWAKESLGEAAAMNLADCLLAVVHQELVPDEKQGWKLQVAESLLFTKHLDNARSLIRKGEHAALNNIILEQQNYVEFNGTVE